ncbi:MAG: mannose-1-phosphate guanylyltransferase [Phycisphaerales bacterium]|nr:mannose-1-phosphate guanylyltransferase [Phycisphaerales bacterium]
MRHAMIMAGGSGTRLWPMSRVARPKQLVPLFPEGSLLALSAARLEGVVPPERRWICTGERFREAVLAGIPGIEDQRILGEPVGRDTVNAVGLTAAVLHAEDPEATFAVLTADHLIEPQSVFADRLDAAFGLVEADPSRFVTFAITPTFPATGFGYVQRGEQIEGHSDCYLARRFVEKPDLDTARSFLEAGDYGWNSGMFVFHAATVLEALGRYEPDIRAGLDRIVAAWNTPDRSAVLAEVYPTLRKVSVDYALMEPAAADAALSVCVVPMELSWQDVGSWPSFGDTIKPDDAGNRVAAGTELTNIDSKGLLVASNEPGHRICTIGCEDLVIVHTADATLICHADDAQKVKDMAGIVPEDLR